MASHEDRRRVGNRLGSLQYIVTVVFSILAVSFWVLQVVQHAKFEEMAENNHQRTLALRAPRGLVLDRNGKILVDNRGSYSISIVREHTTDLNRPIRLLSAVLAIDENGVRALGGKRPRDGGHASPRADLPSDHGGPGCDARAGRGGQGAAARLRTARHRRRAGAD